jgi:hypothetical protein
MKVLGDLDLHTELLARLVRREDLCNGAGLGTGHPHDPARLKTGDLLELGVDRKFLRERHLPIADHEQADGKQHQAAHHEHADPRESRRCSH